jgi:hypothetical protein
MSLILALFSPELIVSAGNEPPTRRSDAKLEVILCTCVKPEVLSPEADLRPRPSMHTLHISGTEKEELRSGHPVQYLNNMSHGQKLKST